MNRPATAPRTLIGALLLLLLFLPTGHAQVRSAHTLEHDGLTREYLLTRPSDPGRFDGSLPLLLVLHPSGGDGAWFADRLAFDALAEAVGLVVAYPTGPGGYWDYGAGLPAWEGVPDVRDDVGFLAALLDLLTFDPAVDGRRVFAVGWSNGARMAYRLACELPERIVAVAGVASTVSDEVTAACRPGAVGALLVHGTADEVSPFAGKPLRIGARVIATALSAPDAALFWAERNGCTRVEAAPAARDDAGNPLIVQEAYSGCAGGREVVFLTLVGGGHGWPPGLEEPILGFFARQAPLP